MIIVLFGQPHSGKTTLATELQKKIGSIPYYPKPVIIDGDDVRKAFNDRGYDKEGRQMRNLQRIADIATYHEKKGLENQIVLVSAMFPYREARDYLRKYNPDSKWVYLVHFEERGREHFAAKDFEIPDAAETHLRIDTTNVSVKSCAYDILDLIFSS